MLNAQMYDVILRTDDTTLSREEPRIIKWSQLFIVSEKQPHHFEKTRTRKHSMSVSC